MAAPDFDIDPHPANGARDGTWNPGVLFVRATLGGRALVAAELAALASAGRDLLARKLTDVRDVSDQSELCRLLDDQLMSSFGEGLSGFEHAYHPLDLSLLHVPLALPPAAASAAATAAKAANVAASGARPAAFGRQQLLPWECDATPTLHRRRQDWRRRRRKRTRAEARLDARLPWWCLDRWAALRVKERRGRVDAAAMIGFFPVLQFGSFLATQVVREAALYGVGPLAMHATHIVGSDVIFKRNNRISMGECTHPLWCLGVPHVTTAAVKALTMRSRPHGLWSVPDPPSYYEGRFLSYRNRPARRFRRLHTVGDGDAQWVLHMALLQEQLQDFQAALATALALNRTLVLPTMLCSCVYAQWPFVGAGNVNCQPMHMQGLYPRLYECPPSYWLSLPAVLRADVPMREAGFLTHARAAPLRASRLSLALCEPPPTEADGAGARAALSGGGAEAPSSPPLSAAMLCTGRGVPLVRAHAVESEVRRALAPLHRVRVLHLNDARASFGGFERRADAAAFHRRTEQLLGVWCCVQTKTKLSTIPGGVLALGRAHAHAYEALRDVDRSAQTMASLRGNGFRLRFRPRLGVVTSARGGRSGRVAAPPQWVTVRRVNNVFGRAELRRDTACCKYIGRHATLEACTAAAEAHPLHGARVSSVTFHLPTPRASQESWQSTCYAIIDGTWQPVKVAQGQAVADSARRQGSRPLPPAAELTTEWVDE